MCADRFITSNQRDFPATITEVQVTYPADLAGTTDGDTSTVAGMLAELVRGRPRRDGSAFAWSRRPARECPAALGCARRASPTTGLAGMTGRDDRCRGGAEVVVDRPGDRLDGGDAVGHGRVVLGQHDDAVAAAVAGEAADAVDAPAVRGAGQPAVLDMCDQAGWRADRDTPALGGDDLGHQAQRAVA